MTRNFHQVQQALATTLRAARRRCGLSQETFAFGAGVDRTYVSQTERAIGNPSVVVLAERLGVDTAFLLSTPIQKDISTNAPGTSPCCQRRRNKFRNPRAIKNHIPRASSR